MTTFFDFTGKALEYLNYVGTALTNRDCKNSFSDHDKTITWITGELTGSGYTNDRITVTDEEVEGNPMHNIILHVTGHDSSRQIIIGAHYDGDGVGDNGSGLALLLATATGLNGIIPPYDVKFIFFDGEEVGLYGSLAYVNSMTEEEIAKTLFMINMDSLVFGDYCNIYGGITGKNGRVSHTEIYDLACSKAKKMNFKVWGPAELNGYFAEHGTGPEIEENALYTNPWTAENPAPQKLKDSLTAYSPSTIPYSDHIHFQEKGIPYVYFEATNWFAGEGRLAYTGYIETYDLSLGDGGMFMNTAHDTLEELNSIFPGRAEAHFRLYSPLLSSLILEPFSSEQN